METVELICKITTASSCIAIMVLLIIIANKVHEKRTHHNGNSNNDSDKNLNRRRKRNVVPGPSPSNMDGCRPCFLDSSKRGVEGLGGFSDVYNCESCCPQEVDGVMINPTFFKYTDGNNTFQACIANDKNNTNYCYETCSYGDMGQVSQKCLNACQNIN